jgi:hypothetical protein
MANLPFILKLFSSCFTDEDPLSRLKNARTHGRTRPASTDSLSSFTDSESVVLASTSTMSWCPWYLSICLDFSFLAISFVLFAVYSFLNFVFFRFLSFLVDSEDECESKRVSRGSTVGTSRRHAHEVLSRSLRKAFFNIKPLTIVQFI